MAALGTTEIKVNAAVDSAELKAQTETEITLPDYLPDIQKIVKVEALPSVNELKCSKDQVSAEGEVMFSILYLPEDSLSIRMIRARGVFENAVEVKGAGEGCRVFGTEKMSFINCKTQSARKLSITAGVSVCVLVETDKDIIIAAPAEDDNVEMKHETADCCVFLGSGEKVFKLEEDIEIPDSMPQASMIVNQSATVCVNEIKTIKDKAVVRGEAVISTLYLSDMESGKLETLSVSLPYHQILEVAGVEEDDTCRITAKLKAGDFALYENASGENRIISASCEIMIICNAYSCKELSLLSDAYSPTGKCELKQGSAELMKLCGNLSSTANINAQLDLPHKLDTIVYAAAQPSVVSCEVSQGVLKVAGELDVSLLIKCEGQAVDGYDETIPFAAEMPVKCGCSKYYCTASAALESLSSVVTAENKVEIRATVRVDAQAECAVNANFVENIDLTDEGSDKYNPYLVICYTQQGEPLYDIAKRYNTTAKRIKSVNDLDSEASDGRMLIIPRSRV